LSIKVKCPLSHPSAHEEVDGPFKEVDSWMWLLSISFGNNFN
jgi:hypothetical protein